MAKKVNKEDFADVPEMEDLGGGFEDKPMPSVDQIEASAPPADYVEAMKNNPPVHQVYRQESMAQIIDEFWRKISNHPDCKVMSSSLGGRPRSADEFKDTPSYMQHQMEFRFIYRDAKSTQVQEQAKVGPYEPGGKYYHMIPKKGEAAAEQEPGSTPKEDVRERGRPSWDNIIRKREVVSV
jgi:hypothetical protein